MNKAEFNKMKAFFDNNPIPEKPIRIDKCSVCLDPKKMVESHIKALESNHYRDSYTPYIDRLRVVSKHMVRNKK